MLLLHWGNISLRAEWLSTYVKGSWLPENTLRFLFANMFLTCTINFGNTEDSFFSKIVHRYRNLLSIIMTCSTYAIAQRSQSQSGKNREGQERGKLRKMNVKINSTAPENSRIRTRTSPQTRAQVKIHLEGHVVHVRPTPDEQPDGRHHRIGLRWCLRSWFRNVPSSSSLSRAAQLPPWASPLLLESQPRLSWVHRTALLRPLVLWVHQDRLLLHVILRGLRWCWRSWLVLGYCLSLKLWRRIK